MSYSPIVFSLLVSLLFVPASSCSRGGEDSSKPQPAATTEPPQPSQSVAVSQPETIPTETVQAPQPTPPKPQPTPKSERTARPGPSQATPAPSQTAPAPSAATPTSQPTIEPPKADAEPAPEPVPVLAPVPRRADLEQVATPPSPPRAPTATLASGTALEVRLTQALSSEKNRSGDRFEAALDHDLSVDGKILVPRRSRVIGKLVEVVEAGKVEGRAHLSLVLTEIEVGEKPYPIETNTISIEAESTSRRDTKTVGGAAGLGAIIGGIAGGKKGAAIGATIGGGAAAAGVLLTQGKEVKLEPEQKFSFRLEKDVQITIR